MSHNKDDGPRTGLHIQESLAVCGISPKDYDDLIRGLFLAGPKEPSSHGVRKFDRSGYSLATTEVRRVFDGATVVAEDRGPVYAVWVSKIDEDGTVEVVGFAEFPWGQM